MHHKLKLKKMTILIYDYHELEERSSRHLKTWKAWHTSLYIIAAVLGIANYAFLQTSMQLIDNNCILYPVKLEFHWVEKPELKQIKQNSLSEERNAPNVTQVENERIGVKINGTNNAQDSNDGTVLKIVMNKERERRETRSEVEKVMTINETTVEESNSTVLYENVTSRLVLFTARTLFAKDSHCQFPEYMPLISTGFAILWAALFIICPGGGRPSSGLKRPWRILTPALIFAFVFVALTGHSFLRTNGGLHAFCAAFSEYTNVTTCSEINQFIERSWNTSWPLSGRVAATRAASAGVWTAWVCVAALLLARCLAAPDFTVKRTSVFLISDPHQKVTRHLSKSPRRIRSQQNTPSKKDNVSVKSEPTTMTEVVTASVELSPDSEPVTASASLDNSPIKKKEEAIALTYNFAPKEQ